MDKAVYWFALAAVLLFLKMFALSLYQAYIRFSRLTFKTPEDVALTGGRARVGDLPEVSRAARAWLNDLENIPIFLALAVAYVWVGASEDLAAWLFMAFTAARYAHTVAYLAGLQPWRSLAYTAGVICSLIMSLQIVLGLL